MRPAKVEFDGVEKRFASAVALDRLDLTVEAGELMVIVGPSGCGKSTTLRLLAGLEEPTAGEIRIDGVVVNGVEPRRRDVAMVFQNYALYPHLSVRRNIEFPLRARSVPAPERERLVQQAATALHLTDLLQRRPGQLSGGQRQRVALARAIVRDPKAFLMDEPLSNLDARLRVGMRAELIDLQRRTGATVLYVTHDQVEAMTMGHRIAIMRDGLLQQVGTPSDVHDRPANVFVAGFVGSPPMNIMKGTLAPRGASTDAGLAALVPGGQIPVPAGFAPGPVVVGVRPENLTIDPAGTLSATVGLVEALGHEYHVACRLPTEDGEPVLVIVRVPSSASPPTVGEAVRLGVTGAVHVFDAASGARLDPDAGRPAVAAAPPAAVDAGG